MPLTLLECDIPIPEREKHTYIKKSGECIIPMCNVQTTPGDLTERGCVHGPIGCAYYTWGGGRRQNLSDNPEFHRKYCFSTSMQEANIIFGGEQKLHKAILEAYERFPDVNGVLGFRGVSQSLGHHIANDVIFERIIGTKEPDEVTPYDINIIGEYNIQGDLWIIAPLFEAMGLRILCTFTGNSSIDDLAMAHRAKLNVMHCQRSTPYICQLMEEKYELPYMPVSLFGVEQTSKALRDVASFFGLEEQAEMVIESEIAKILPQIEYYKEKLKGKRVFIYQGAPRAWHWIKLMDELGMQVIGAATTFGHTDDYEKIIERIGDGAIVIDNPNSVELKEMLVKYKPDLFISGLKEKFLAYKLGVPFVNGHAYENGPYAVYSGFVNFARDMDMTINHPAWKLIEGRT
jgi:nitrogenase molybdenum-iron protein alpha chain